MQYSLLQQAFITSFLRIKPNISEQVLMVIADLINAFECGQTYLDLKNYDLTTINALNCCDLVGSSGEFKPLIKDNNYLYLARYYAYESYLIEQLLKRSAQKIPIDQDKLNSALDQLFAENTNTQDLQKEAVIHAVNNSLTIIAGGPGTGKTTTIVKILLAIIAQKPNYQLKIALCAPTGKAAGRMIEAINNVLPNLPIADNLKRLIPNDTFTLHRLLGSSFNTQIMNHNLTNQLDLDLLIIDEASMLDLALMSKTLMALPQNARLILLGDSNQLSAVEAGAIFGDLCRQNTKLTKNVIELKKSHRFQKDSAIGNFVNAVKNGKSEQAINLLNQTNLTRHDLNLDELKQYLISKYQPLLNCANENNNNPAVVFQEFANFRALSAHNHGKFGVNNLNQFLDNYFAHSNSAPNLTTNNYSKNHQDHSFYSGKVIMITQNNYQLKLFNGDIGLCLLAKNPADGKIMPRVFFEYGNEFKSFAPVRLPAYTSAFVMTVHKSQGSEFNHVALIFDGQNKLINRSLLYTAVTRAKLSAAIWAETSNIKYAINNNSQLISSLATRIS